MPRMKDWELKYWESQRGEQTCRDCGKTGHSAYVQPQMPRRKKDLATFKSYALCIDCIDAHNSRVREERKAELDQRPKCQRCGTRPVTWRVQRFGLCGRCKTAVMKEHTAKTAPFGALALTVHEPLVDTSTWANP